MLLVCAKALVFSMSFMLFRCSEEQPLPDAEARVETNLGLTTSSAMDGKISIQQAYLKLDHIRVIGNSADRVTNILYDINADEPPYQLAHADSNRLEFTLPAYTYEQLDFHLFLNGDDYPLAFTASPAGEVITPTQEENIPDPTESDDNKGEDQGDQDDSPDNADDKPADDPANNGDGNTGNDDPESGDQVDDNPDKKDQDDNKDQDDKKDPDDKKDQDNNKDQDDKKDEDDKKHDDNPKDKKDDKKGKDNDPKKDKDDKKNDKDKDQTKDKDKGKGKNDDKKGDKKNDKKPGPNGREAIDSEIVDLDGFFRNARPALVVFAMYEGDNSTIQLIFAATDVEKLSLHARQNDGTQVLLGPNNAAKVTFNPNQWFDSLTPADIEAGSLQLYHGKEVLFIHKDYNTTLYEAIVSRLEPSTDLTIEMKDGM